MSLIDDLRELAGVLSPSFHVNTSEVQGVVSALVQVAEHGEPLLTAVGQGAQAVADFYHEVEVKHAAAVGADPPVKGAPVVQAPAGAQAAPAATPAQIDALLKQVQALSAAVAASQRSPEATVTPIEETPAEGGPEPAAPAAPAHTGILSGLLGRSGE